MSNSRGSWVCTAVAALAPLMAATPASAQGVPIALFASGGGYSSVSDPIGNPDFDTGFSVAGGLGVELSDYVVLRGDLSFAKSDFRRALPVGGVARGSMDRWFYTADMQLQYPTGAGFTPYLLAGGGAVTLRNTGVEAADATQPAGHFGAGLEFAIPQARHLGAFLQLAGYLYDHHGLRTGASNTADPDIAGVEQTQFDLAWEAGFSYRLN